jgi:hypothetical protein
MNIIRLSILERKVLLENVRLSPSFPNGQHTFLLFVDKHSFVSCPIWIPRRLGDGASIIA